LLNLDILSQIVASWIFIADEKIKACQFQPISILSSVFFFINILDEIVVIHYNQE